MNDGGYAWEKLYTAVLILAKGSGRLQERLRDAYVPHLISLQADHHFPWPSLRRRFVDLMDEVAPNGDFGTALSNWPDYDLQRIATELVGLYDSVTRHMEPSE